MTSYALLVIAGVLAISGLVRVALPTGRLIRDNLFKYRHLRKLRHSAQAVADGADLLKRVAEAEARCRRALREDFVVTGAALATLGLGAVFLGQGMAYGSLAVAAYLTGLISIVLGVAVALVGSIARVLARPVLPDTRAE